MAMRSPLMIWFSRSPLCEGLSDDEIAQVFALFELKEAPSGSTLYEAGSPADALYVVLEGSVTVWREGKLLGEVTPGGSIGERSLFTRAEERSATTKCATDVTVLRIERQRFHDALAARDIPAMMVFNLAQQFALRLAP
jgi:CRP-like cAMP-binding protein